MQIFSFRAFDADAQCPRWIQFNAQITGSDAALCEYLQRVVGYSLTGLTDDQCFLFFWGEGSNGKTTFLEIIASLLGDCAQELPTSVIADGGREMANANTPEIAKLKGARFVQVNEVNENMRFSSAIIKNLTGSDRITACAKYEAPISFDPRFKVVVRGNNRPTFRGSEPRKLMVRFVSGAAAVESRLADYLVAEGLAYRTPGAAWVPGQAVES